ncbi:HAD-like protein [Brevundimonas phage vB_BpoS-Kikimora]|uniref:HAD-like protein n=1 Tax=Brevundimonas phage vB_BpoS-Kikimora TaxID=2948601 RepID=A0A9E7SMT2_9CAUD|nr:HAD-like protein [Brevundimonas phage vB_BpoS-Kikimora]
MTKLISLDVWNTLLSSQPAYAEARDRLFEREFDLPLAQVKAIYRDHKDGADRAAEAFGEGLSSEEVYRKFHAALGLGSDYAWQRLRQGLEDAFEAYPPLMPDVTVNALHEAVERGYRLSIASNTNFIRGAILLRAVERAIDRSAFEFTLFSDEIGFSKPHEQVWNLLKFEARDRGIMPHEIIHVGDNPVCDGACVAHGLPHAYTANPTETASVIHRIISA